MKCYTVTESGVTPGINVTDAPYPHVAIGDPHHEANFRRVKLDEALQSSSASGAITQCSPVLSPNDDDRRRASYLLSVPNGKDDDQALVKLEVKPEPGNRSWYDLPRYALTIAKGWFTRDDSTARVAAPVELVVIKRGQAVRIYETDGSNPTGRMKYALAFDGAELKRET